MNLQDLSAIIDIDVQGSLARFSNFEPMYIKYLKRFNTEPTYEALKAAVESRDFGAIETSAHTLKGIAGNLGLNTLYAAFNEIVQAVRSQDHDKAIVLCQDIDLKVEQVKAAIAQLDQLFQSTLGVLLPQKQ